MFLEYIEIIFYHNHEMEKAFLPRGGLHERPKWDGESFLT